MRRPRVEAEPSACILGAFLLLILPARWLFAAALAAGFHELCHLLALRIMGIPVWELRISLHGAVIRTAPMPPGKELAASLAGPLGSLLLLLPGRWLPRTALCAVIQTAYNLLPVFPLDGGRALRSGIRLLTTEEKADSISFGISLGTAALILLAAVILRLGLLVPALILLPVLRQAAKRT